MAIHCREAKNSLRGTDCLHVQCIGLNSARNILSLRWVESAWCTIILYSGYGEPTASDRNFRYLGYIFFDKSKWYYMLDWFHKARFIKHAFIPIMPPSVILFLRFVYSGLHPNAMACCLSETKKRIEFAALNPSFCRIFAQIHTVSPGFTSCESEVFPAGWRIWLILT